MSQFSNYLKELISSHGESIASLSRNLGIERTSIHKALADERTLSYKSVQALAQHFELTIDERQEFFRLYDTRLQGEEVCENRQAVCKLLNTLAAIDFTMPSPPEVTSAPVTDHIIRGEYAVRSLIRSILIYETSHSALPDITFELFVPKKLDLTMELMELWLNDRKFTVHELLCLESGHCSKSSSSARNNLQKLGSVIPLCLASRGNYKPYSFKKSAQTYLLSPLNYYIITPNYLILLSEDLNFSQITKNKELISCYLNFFHTLIQNCNLWVQCSSNILEVLQEYITQTDTNNLQVLMSQPCPGRYITPEIIKKYMCSGDMPYNSMLHLVEKHFSTLRNISQNYQTIFSEDGLANLVQTGNIEDLPPQYVPPLESSDIKFMLTSLYNETLQGSITSLIVRPNIVQIPDYLTIYANRSSGLHLYTTNSFIFGAYCCDIHISDNALCKIFSDFFHGLSGSPIVYSTEDTLYILKKYIDQLP